ncbi:MAG: DNA alkylation repair protein, partial [bacterium]
RRLVSEGTRPRLPWGRNVAAIDANPEVILDLVSPLRLDASEYVRRSVANHLNDWTKTHAQDVVRRVKGWGQSPSEIWVQKHALRSLVKRGHSDAIALLGFQGDLVCDGIEMPGTVSFPGSFEIVATLRNPGTERAIAVVDYGISHQGANGPRPAKVFKWKTVTLDPGACTTIRKTHAVRPITTRRYYNGPHEVSVHCNGVSVANATFELEGV